MAQANGFSLFPLPIFLCRRGRKRTDRIFDSLLWLILWFIFLPTPLLWYTAVQHWFGGEWTLWPLVGIVIAIVIDVSPAGRRRRD